jgi:hypothetical protein
LLFKTFVQVGEANYDARLAKALKIEAQPLPDETPKPDVPERKRPRQRAEKKKAAKKKARAAKTPKQDDGAEDDDVSGSGKGESPKAWQKLELFTIPRQVSDLHRHCTCCLVL